MKTVELNRYYDVEDIFTDDEIINYVVNMNVDQVYPEKEILGFVQTNYSPEEVFTEEQLKAYFDEKGTNRDT